MNPSRAADEPEPFGQTNSARCLPLPGFFHLLQCQDARIQIFHPLGYLPRSQESQGDPAIGGRLSKYVSKGQTECMSSWACQVVRVVERSGVADRVPTVDDDQPGKPLLPRADEGRESHV